MNEHQVSLYQMRCVRKPDRSTHPPINHQKPVEELVCLSTNKDPGRFRGAARLIKVTKPPLKIIEMFLNNIWTNFSNSFIVMMILECSSPFCLLLRYSFFLIANNQIYSEQIRHPKSEILPPVKVPAGSKLSPSSVTHRVRTLGLNVTLNNKLNIKKEVVQKLQELKWLSFSFKRRFGSYISYTLYTCHTGHDNCTGR